MLKQELLDDISNPYFEQSQAEPNKIEVKTSLHLYST